MLYPIFLCLCILYTFCNFFASLDIIVPDEKVQDYAAIEIEPYFETTIRGLESVGNATITTYAISGNVEVPGVAYTYTAVNA